MRVLSAPRVLSLLFLHLEVVKLHIVKRHPGGRMMCMF